MNNLKIFNNKEKEIVERMILAGLNICLKDDLVEPSLISFIKDYFSYFEDEEPGITSYSALVYNNALVSKSYLEIDLEEELEAIKELIVDADILYIVDRYFEEVSLVVGNEVFDSRRFSEHLVGYEKIFSSNRNLRILVRAGLAVAHMDEGVDPNVIRAIMNFFARHSSTDWIEEKIDEIINEEMVELLSENIGLFDSIQALKWIYSGNELLVCEYFESIVMAFSDCEFSFNQEILEGILDILDE